MSHTPLPWEAQQADEIDVFVPIIGVRLGDDGKPLHSPTNGLVGGATLFPTEADAEDYERAKANAAFIVRACNSHCELLEALIEARAALHQHYVDWDGEPEDSVPLQLARSKCDAAIAKARGE